MVAVCLLIKQILTFDLLLVGVCLPINKCFPHPAELIANGFFPKLFLFTASDVLNLVAGSVQGSAQLYLGIDCRGFRFPLFTF